MAKASPAAGQARAAVRARELRDILAPYTDPRGGHRCPLDGCGAPIRVLDGPPACIAGCEHCDDLLRLAVDAIAYRSTLPGAA